MKLIPGTLPSGTRRRVPKASQNRKVPLWTVEPDGEEMQGFIRVPVRLANTQEHTNERLEFMALINRELTKWVEWKRKQGWILSGDIETWGPEEPPDSDKAKVFAEYVVKQVGKSGSAAFNPDFDYPEEFKHYWAKGRFRRETPIYAGLEDMLELRHLALLHGVDPDRDKPLETPLPRPKDFLAFEGGVDPMVLAEERRQAKGIRRKDYLFGPLWRPL